MYRTPSSRPTPTLLGLAVLAFSAARAAEPATSLDEIVVTATRSAQPRALTGESVTLLDAEDVSTLQSVGLGDVLQLTPGLTVVRNGGPGQPSAIGLRGALAGQTLLLIDGIRLNDPSATDGAAMLSDVLLNNVERVEVLRGPQSTLYGSEAIGGVVNVMSVRGGEKPFAPSALLEAGSLGSWRLALAARGSSGALDYGAGLGALHTNAVSAADARNGNTERDPFGHDGATLNLRWHASEALSLDARGYATDSRVSFDGYPPPDYTFKDTAEYGRNRLVAAYLGANLDLFENQWHQRLAYLRTASDRTQYDPTLPVTETFLARGQSRRVEYQSTYDLSASEQVVFGAETQRTSLRTASPSPYDPNPAPTLGEQRLTGYFLQAQGTVAGQLTLTGGVRRDDNAAFGTHESLKLAAAWRLPSTGSVLRANYGDGFKAPSLYELYSEYSNPLHALAPESARGWEAGVDQPLLGGRALLSVMRFDRRTHNQIDFFDCYLVTSGACATRPYGYYENLVSTHARGTEVEARLQPSAALTIGANVSLLDATDASTGNDLARRPRRMANLRVEATPASGWQVGALWRYVGPQYDDPYQSVLLPGYTLLDLHVSWAVTRQFTLQGRMENALDRRYSPVAGYGALPRTGTLGLRWVPAP
jgi:vitamin B12 transporter